MTTLALVDSSVWVSFFRDPTGPLGQRFSHLISSDPDTLCGCPPVRYELALDPQELRRFRTLKVYDGFVSVSIANDDFDLAAEIYRSVQRVGHTIRSHLDCLVAAMAVRVGATVVHNDVDFDRMAEVVARLAVLRLPDG